MILITPQFACEIVDHETPTHEPQELRFDGNPISVRKAQTAPKDPSQFLTALFRREDHAKYVMDFLHRLGAPLQRNVCRTKTPTGIDHSRVTEVFAIGVTRHELIILLTHHTITMDYDSTAKHSDGNTMAQSDYVDEIIEVREVMLGD